MRRIIAAILLDRRPRHRRRASSPRPPTRPASRPPSRPPPAATVVAPVVVPAYGYGWHGFGPGFGFGFGFFGFLGTLLFVFIVFGLIRAIVLRRPRPARPLGRPRLGGYQGWRPGNRAPRTFDDWHRRRTTHRPGHRAARRRRMLRPADPLPPAATRPRASCPGTHPRSLPHYDASHEDRPRRRRRGQDRRRWPATTSSTPASRSSPRPTGRRRSRPPGAAIRTWSCSTSGCPDSTVSTSPVSCAATRRSRS